MNSSPKRRARFKKGVTPPPLIEEKKNPALSEWERYLQRGKEREKRREELIRNRKPLPDENTISERFLESTLRCFALASPEFWHESTSRWFHYPSDFMGKLRLGQHLDSYEDVLATCKKVKFPTLRYGRVVADFRDDDSSNRRRTPDISFQLAETAEWIEAQDELRTYLGIGEAKNRSNPKAQSLIDFARSVEPGKEVEVPRELYREWNSTDQATAVRLAQRVDPRLDERSESYWNVKILVRTQPNPLFTLPSLNLPLDLPSKPTKSDLDRMSRRIESMVKNEVLKGHGRDAGMVLAQTTSRFQAKKLFGYPRINPLFWIKPNPPFRTHLSNVNICKLLVTPIRRAHWWQGRMTPLKGCLILRLIKRFILLP